MLCTECGGAVITKVFTDFLPNQHRVWFWALRCNQCGHLEDAGLRPDARSCPSSGEHRLRKSQFGN
jgi:hypothetical protein